MRPKRSPDSGTGTGGSSGQPTPAPTPEPSPTPAPAPEPTPSPTPNDQGGTPPSGYVPVDQLRAVAAERDRLKREADERSTEEAKKQGEWQTLAEKNEAKAKTFEQRFMTTARRAAFVSKIASQVVDPDAAYKLALADGLLADVKVDDDGNADVGAIDSAVKKAVETYKFLKAGNGSFGGDRSGQQPEPAPNLANASPRERMRVAYESTARRG